jgi:hypothetical protein
MWLCKKPAASVSQEISVAQQEVCVANQDQVCASNNSQEGASKAMLAKAIKDIMPAPRPHWVGDGFHVFPVFSRLAFSSDISPFLMFDYAAPKEFTGTTKRRGVGEHPHRGFETVTIAFQGEVEHGDSLGNTGIIGPGDIQWMTAGRGIVHKEHHSAEFSKRGGTFEMCQLWVNLPAKHKMTPPNYQPILAQDVPEVPFSADDPDKKIGCVRIIAGSYQGIKGPANTFTPINLWDVQMRAKGRAVDLELPAGHNTLVFVRKGSIKVGANGVVGPQGMVRLEMDGTLVRLEATEAGTQLLLLGGEPINEPIAHRGPFVMNTNAELAKANDDYRSGVLGK